MATFGRRLLYAKPEWSRLGQIFVYLCIAITNSFFPVLFFFVKKQDSGPLLTFFFFGGDPRVINSDVKRNRFFFPHKCGFPSEQTCANTNILLVVVSFTCDIRLLVVVGDDDYPIFHPGFNRKQPQAERCRSPLHHSFSRGPSK